MFYSLMRALLFRLESEQSHDLALRSLRFAARTGVLRRIQAPPPAVPCRVMGLDFPNPVGLAAGLDKNADYLAALADLGFGFIEVGTVTPRPQPGNPQPRLFRLPAANALINRLGFNNHGIDYLIERVRQSGFDGILGINIGKNFDTPLSEAGRDYRIGLRKAYPYASYITVNISSPNTPGLRDLQYGDPLQRLLAGLKQEQQQLATEHGRYVPLALKIAPDLNDSDIPVIANTLVNYEIDGVIATNTTFSRSGVAGLPHADEAGGLSGAPLSDRATTVVRELDQVLAGRLPIIAVGGIMSSADVLAKFEAGASLVQLYTGLIYRGPVLIGEAVHAGNAYFAQTGCCK